MTTRDLANKLRAMGVCTFEPHRGRTAKLSAQNNLAGRTHYFEDATLKCFGGRVLHCDVTPDGLMLTCIESLQLEGDARLYRPVFFDLWGNTHCRPNLEACYTTPRAAQQAYRDALTTLDPVDITRRALVQRRAKLEREILDIDGVLL